MSKSRMINTKFWDDDYTSNLDPIEKLLFLYFLTNTSTNICGIYEIPLKKIAVETGIDREMVSKVVQRFTNDGKVFYHNGWLCMKNFVKNQNQNSPTVQKGIEREIMAVPKDILGIFIGYGYGIDTLSHLTKPNLTKPNGSTDESEPVETSKNKDDVLNSVPEVVKAFESVDPKNKTYYANKTQRAACEFLIKEYSLEKVLKMIEILPKINQKKLYIKQVTTPWELKENWVKIANAFKQEQSDPKNKPNFIL